MAMAFDGTKEPYEQPPYRKIIAVLIVIVLVITFIWALFVGVIRLG
jgi:hypothetical protein